MQGPVVGPGDTEIKRALKSCPQSIPYLVWVAVTERENNKVVRALRKGSKDHYGST